MIDTHKKWSDVIDPMFATSSTEIFYQKTYSWRRSVKNRSALPTSSLDATRDLSKQPEEEFPFLDDKTEGTHGLDSAKSEPAGKVLKF
jgi:hypothetical protein